MTLGERSIDSDTTNHLPKNPVRVLTQMSISGPVYTFPSKTSGAAYGGEPHQVVSAPSAWKNVLKPQSAILIWPQPSIRRFSTCRRPPDTEDAVRTAILRSGYNQNYLLESVFQSEAPMHKHRDKMFGLLITNALY